MNPTLLRFGWPRTMLSESDHWVVLARPAQPTLGSLVLAAKSDATAFPALPSAAFADLAPISARVERALAAAVAYRRINYLMLMMVDPNVHFHVIPRYDGSRTWQGRDFPDRGWPKTPDLAGASGLPDDTVDALVAWLTPFFGAPGPPV